MGKTESGKLAYVTFFIEMSLHPALLCQKIVVRSPMPPETDRNKFAILIGGNILIHHTRDTAEKQWAETRVLSLAGVARTFNSKRRVLQHLGQWVGSHLCVTWMDG